MRVGGVQKFDIFDNFSKTALREVSGTTFLPTFVILGSILGGNWGHFWSHFRDFFQVQFLMHFFHLWAHPAAAVGGHLSLARLDLERDLERDWRRFTTANIIRDDAPDLQCSSSLDPSRWTYGRADSMYIHSAPTHLGHLE